MITQYILPKQTHPFPRKSGPTSTQQAQEQTITAVLKPMRSGETVTLTGITLDTSILDIKSQYAKQTDQPQDKIKLLLNKKPTADLKSLKELGVNGDVEFSVMIMSGNASTTPITEKSEPDLPVGTPTADKMEVDEKAPAPDSEKAQAAVDAAQGGEVLTEEVLKSEEFWADLKGFLAQRLRDEKTSETLATIFRDAWKQRQ